MSSEDAFRYRTRGGVEVDRVTYTLDGLDAAEALIDALDSHQGVLLTSTYEYPGRYTRWDIGFVDPPLQITCKGRNVTITALNERGQVLLDIIKTRSTRWVEAEFVSGIAITNDSVSAEVVAWTASFTEEQRTRQPSVFSVLRDLLDLFGSDEDRHLGLYGAFGYDLAFQFDPIDLKIQRPDDQRDLVLYLPDRLIVVDHKREVASRFQYDFEWKSRSTHDLPRVPATSQPFVVRSDVSASGDHEPGQYVDVVKTAHEYFQRGDLFEVVPGQVFYEPTTAPPSELFRRLRKRNPAPYGALMNLGDNEYLISASPEMYVRVEGTRVETCPISGTIARGTDVLSDADQILQLLNSEKDASELTMCTDVDRNDKSRVCIPESIKVIGRRQIEMYSRLIHTVDHVEGTLLPEFDGLDAFLSHTWAVTVTGAPKLWAMRFIEDHERSSRAWYGGAIGALLANGDINTGLTLRTIRVKDGIAQVRAGATLLIDSDPEAEERETRVKASALLDAIRHADEHEAAHTSTEPIGVGVNVLLIDHEDSFVHTLAGYFRRAGTNVTTVRVPMGAQLDDQTITNTAPDLVVISPGPGEPSDFNLSNTLQLALAADRPVFGVCLGLQAIVEHFGGKLGVLDRPAHGRSSIVTHDNSGLFTELPSMFAAGRYHSLFAEADALPTDLRVTARTEDGVIMGVAHASKPIAAVQFHPESLMTMHDDVGFHLIENVIKQLVLTPAR